MTDRRPVRAVDFDGWRYACVLAEETERLRSKAGGTDRLPTPPKVAHDPGEEKPPDEEEQKKMPNVKMTSETVLAFLFQDGWKTAAAVAVAAGVSVHTAYVHLGRAVRQNTVEIAPASYQAGREGRTAARYRLRTVGEQKTVERREAVRAAVERVKARVAEARVAGWPEKRQESAQEAVETPAGDPVAAPPEKSIKRVGEIMDPAEHRKAVRAACGFGGIRKVKADPEPAPPEKLRSQTFPAFDPAVHALTGPALEFYRLARRNAAERQIRRMAADVGTVIRTEQPAVEALEAAADAAYLRLIVAERAEE